MQTLQEIFGKRLRIAMLEKDMTQKELASLLCCDQRMISHYACGRRMPRYEMIVDMAEVLGVSLDYLFGRD